MSKNKVAIVGLVLFAIAAYATRCHMGYMNDDTFMFLALMSPWLMTALTGGLGLLAGLFMPQGAFRERLVARTLIGAVAGAALPWVAALYLDLRGHPEAMSKLELFVPSAITLVLALIAYRVVDKVAPKAIMPAPVA